MVDRRLIDRALAEETLREPLAVTCYFEVATLEDEPTFSVAVPIFEARYDESGDRTGQMVKRPERVHVRPVQQVHPVPVVKGKKVAQPRPEPWRPARARPSAPQKKRITPRANTVPSGNKDKLDVFSLAMFWGVALSGSLVAIGIALASW